MPNLRSVLCHSHTIFFRLQETKVEIVHVLHERGLPPEKWSSLMYGFLPRRRSESFNSKLRDELMNGEIFYSLNEAKVIIEGWRCHYNTNPPALVARLPAAVTRNPGVAGCAPGPATPATPALALRPTMN